MLFPIMNEVNRYREMTTTFGGYNHNISCEEGQFYDMKNMTSKYFPVLSPRGKRTIFDMDIQPLAMINKDGLMWVNADYPASVHYIKKTGSVNYKKSILELADSCIANQMVSIGAYVVIFPDNIWIDTSKEPMEWGYLGAYYDKNSISDEHQSISVVLADEFGGQITYQDEDYYKTMVPQNGDYMMSTDNGKPVLKRYSSATSIWSTVATTYLQIQAPFIGKDFKKGDGVTIKAKTEDMPYVLVNDEGDGYHSTNTVIKNCSRDSITIAGIIDEYVKLVDTDFSVERKVPEMAYVTECNNRLWGCSMDGHEIYCCKLGDIKNWYVYEGLATDSWAVTVGSDGEFTGAITYMGYPMFFKEDGFIKISVSSTGGHQLKETKCRGVQKGSEKSLAIVNETLYYKSPTCVVAYNGGLPMSVSDSLGEVRYYNAVSGSIGDRYYISMYTGTGHYSMFVFDQKTGIWCKEDDIRAKEFCAFDGDLYFVRGAEYVYGNDCLCMVEGTRDIYHKPINIIEQETEGNFEWFAESGNIGYSTPDNKYVARINVRISLEAGTNVDFYLQYDSSDEWEHKFNMSGKGTKTFTVPVIPKRCDHFKYKIVGKGGCKIHSITKTIEQGSDL